MSDDQKHKQQEKLVEQMIMVSKTLGCKFSFKKEVVPLPRVFAVDGLLPGIMRRADQLCSFCLGHGLGVTFERADSSLLGTVVRFNDDTPASLRLLCVLDVLVEFVQNSTNKSVVALDALASY